VIPEKKMRALSLSILLLSATAFAGTPAPTTDPTVDWLMNQSTTAPATQPTTQPTPVFNSNATDSSLPGVIELSDGQILHGRLSTTEKKPLRLWIESKKDYQDIPLTSIQSIQAAVLWERDEPEWHFKSTGSDIKEFTGKTYPARETSYRFTLTDGQIIDGSVVAPLILTTPAGSVNFILHKRDKGQTGQTLNQLVYITRVGLGETGSGKK
jgi:hypothetical protein